jgi:hypothetical protein
MTITQNSGADAVVDPCGSRDPGLRSPYWCFAARLQQAQHGLGGGDAHRGVVVGEDRDQG